MVGDPAVGLHQIHQVGDPDDVVQVAAVDRRPAMSGGHQFAHRLRDRGVGRQRYHLAAWDQHVAEPSLGNVEGPTRMRRCWG